MKIFFDTNVIVELLENRLHADEVQHILASEEFAVTLNKLCCTRT